MPRQGWGRTHAEKLPIVLRARVGVDARRSRGGCGGVVGAHTGAVGLCEESHPLGTGCSAAKVNAVTALTPGQHLARLESDVWRDVRHKVDKIVAVRDGVLHSDATGLVRVRHR